MRTTQLFGGILALVVCVGCQTLPVDIPKTDLFGAVPLMGDEAGENTSDQTWIAPIIHPHAAESPPEPTIRPALPRYVGLAQSLTRPSNCPQGHPRDEYLCDGGDSGTGIHVTRDWEVKVRVYASKAETANEVGYYDHTDQTIHVWREIPDWIMVHELCHAWFLENFASDYRGAERWLIEGLCHFTSEMVCRRTGR